MRTGMIALLAGIATALLYPIKLPIGLLATLLLVSLPLLYLRRLRIMILFIIGLGWCALYANFQLSVQLPREFEGRDLLVTGNIASPVAVNPARIRFLLDVTQATLDSQTIPFTGKIRLSWYRSIAMPASGETWQFRVRLKRPHGFSNPGGFDYQGWLFREGIRATGYIKGTDANQRLQVADCVFSLQCWRALLANKVKNLPVDSTYTGIITALTLGIRDDVSASQRQVFRETGTAHLMAISGLHIGLVAGLVYFLVLYVWRFLPRLCLLLAAPRAAAVAAIIAAVLYALLAGMSIPTQRALIMISVLMLTSIYQRQYAYVDVVLFAAVLINLLFPLSMMDAGFWLSFCAIGVIFYVSHGRAYPSSGFRGMLRIQFAIIIGMVPVLAMVFQQMSLMSPLANMLAVPLMSLLLIPVSLLSVVLAPILPSLSGLLIEFFSFCMYWLLAYLGMLAQLPGNLVQLPALSLIGYLCIGGGIALLLMPAHLPGRWLAVIAIMPLLLTQSPRPRENEFWLSMLDVGQGLAVVIQTRQHTLLYDTGARFSPGFDTGGSVIVPFLRDRGIATLDTVIISHTDNDHVGGLSTLQENVNINSILSGEAEKLKHYQAAACTTGMNWHWDGVYFEVITGLNTRENNNRSCVVKVSNQHFSVLLTGDIEKGVERHLLAQHKHQLKADVLLVPHHGSKTSSTQAFIREVDPKYALVSAGYRNRFRHPHPDILKRYQKLGIKLLNTAEHGMIGIRLADRKTPLQPFTYRDYQRRWWHLADVN